MKKMIAFLAIGLVVALAGSAHAVTTTKCYVTVTICQDLAVSLDTTGGGILDDVTVVFGSPCVQVSDQVLAVDNNDRVVVWNASAAGYADYVLSIDTADTDHPSEWTPSSSVDEETYILYALFNDNLNASSPGVTTAFGAEDILTVSPVVCTDAVYGNGDAGHTGYNVEYDTERGLWFRFDSPTATTRSAEATLPIVVTIQAN